MILTKTSVCCGCGAELPHVDGATHRYMSSSPACWAAFGRVLAREYSDRRLDEVHRLSVDSYAVQHPGVRSPQTIRSIAAHLCRLCTIIEGGFPIERANAVMLEVNRVEDQFRYLEPPSTMGEVTVADVVSAKTVEEHIANVREWARATWLAWSAHHATIRSWLPDALRVGGKMTGVAKMPNGPVGQRSSSHWNIKRMK
jgi:hypothetical protein